MRPYAAAALQQPSLTRVRSGVTNGRLLASNKAADVGEIRAPTFVAKAAGMRLNSYRSRERKWVKGGAAFSYAKA